MLIIEMAAAARFQNLPLARPCTGCSVFSFVSFSFRLVVDV
jgi:hypothetical protein